MLALIASTVLIAYLLVPGILFRFIFSSFIPLENFRRTRSEEFAFGAVTTLLPLTLTLVFVLNIGWFGNHPFSFLDSPAQKWTDYRTAASSLYSETYFLQHQHEFWGLRPESLSGKAVFSLGCMFSLLWSLFCSVGLARILEGSERLNPMLFSRKNF